MRYEPRKVGLTTEDQTILREGAEKQGATYQMNKDLEHFQPGCAVRKHTHTHTQQFVMVREGSHLLPSGLAL